MKSLSNVRKSGRVSALQESTNAQTATRNHIIIMHDLCAAKTNLNIIRSAPNDVNRRQHLHAGDDGQRRLQRYSMAEEALARQFQQCQTETSSRELQIQALERATMLLGAHALDARERVEQLRILLADRSMDPETYESLKRERWVEQNRQSAADRDTVVVRQHLDSLSTPGDPVSFRGSSVISNEDRRCRNLSRFLGSSPAQPSVRIRKATSVLLERAPKRRTLDRVSPMRLRTTSAASFKPLRPLSLDGWARRPRCITSERLPTVSLKIVTEGGPMAINETMSPSTETSPTESTAASSTLPTTAAGCPSPLDSRGKPDLSETGTATIYLSQHYTTQLTADDVDVSLPDYALDLFLRFDSAPPISISPSPSLSLCFDVSPRPGHPQRASLPARSSLQVPAFASPKQKQVTQTSRLGRAKSSRQLGALSAMPEAFSSRIKIGPSDAVAEPSTARSSATSLASHTVSKELKGKGVLSSKLKKRFSILRLGR